jgi:hypothetical protein
MGLVHGYGQWVESWDSFSSLRGDAPMSVLPWSGSACGSGTEYGWFPLMGVSVPVLSLPVLSLRGHGTGRCFSADDAVCLRECCVYGTGEHDGSRWFRTESDPVTSVPMGLFYL